MRDFSTIVPSPRRSTSMSRFSHSTLRKAGFVITAAALPLILRLPEFLVLCGSSLSAPDIDRLSLLKEGPDPFREFLGAAAQDLVAVLHRDDSFERSGIDAHIETFFRQPQANRRSRHHRVDVRPGGFIELLLVHDFRDEPHRKRALSADEASGEDQLGRDRNANEARQEIAGADIAAAEA